MLGGPGYTAPSDKLNIACIGVGGMGEADVKGVAGENIYALCDVDLKASEDTFRKYPAAKKYRDYREMLDQEQKNIDAVTITIPDHGHAAATMMALRLNKNVYCQKPLARTLTEVRTVRAQAAKTKVATQMGNQGHAGDGVRILREWIEAGVIGTVREVQYWTNRPIWPQGLERPTDLHAPPLTLDWNLWLGPAPERPYNPAYAPFRWRGWWDFGTGALGDMACHGMDAAYWILDLGYPERIIPESTRALSGDGAEVEPRGVPLPGQGQPTGGEGRLARWRSSATEARRPAHHDGVAADRHRRAALDRGRRCADCGDVRGGSRPARSEA